MAKPTRPLLLTMHLYPQGHMPPKDWAWTAGAGLLAMILYLPSLQYGLIWDDPSYYRFIAQAPLREILLGSPSFQYYRPLTLLLFRALLTPMGSVRIVPAHLLQLLWHGLNTTLALPALVAVGVDRHSARWGAVLFALYPFSFQAVAWQATSHPWGMLWILLALTLAGHYVRWQRRPSLLLSVASYGIALLSNEMAVPFLALFLWLAARQRSFPRRYVLWPWLHTCLAIAYTGAWMVLPRKQGLAGIVLDTRVLAYLLQGAVQPLARLLGWARWRPSGLAAMAVFGAAIIVFLIILLLLRRFEPAAAGGLIYLAGILPILVGLSWEYVRIGERLLYPASLGVAAWGGGLIAAILDLRSRWRWVLATLVATGLVLPAMEHITTFHQLYARGSKFMNQVSAIVVERHPADLLVVNAPDRLRLRPSPYPVGYWGLVLAPVVQNLEDYARGSGAETIATTRSVAAPTLGADERAASPYHVEMRGIPLSQTELVEAILAATDVCLTTYHDDGRVMLHWAGRAARGSSEGETAIARWDGGLCLRTYALDRDPCDQLWLTLDWHAMAPLPPEETVFVHLLDREGHYVDGADGDPLHGLFPLHLWPSPVAVIDHRPLPWKADLLDSHSITVGIYNRMTGLRRPAWLPTGERVPGDELVLPMPTELW